MSILNPAIVKSCDHAQMRYLVFPSPWGWMGVSGASIGLTHLVLPHSSAGEAEQALFTVGARRAVPGKEDSQNPVFQDLARRLKLYFEGHEVSFPDKVDLAAATPFQREVWLALRDIPYGKTVSYGELAFKSGRPSAARAIGQALHRNPLPIILPCHRVVGSSGKLTGYAGGVDLKRRLLELEARRIT